MTTCLFNEYRASDYAETEKGWLRGGVYYYPQHLEKDPALAERFDARRMLSRKDIRAVVGHFSFGIHEHLRKPWTYLTLVRDPIERVISLFCHICRYGHLHRKVVDENLSIDQFVQDLHCTGADNDQTRRISGKNPPFGECNGAMLAMAKENLARHFSIVGVTERFDETLILIKRRLRWSVEPVYRSGLVNKERPRARQLSTSTLDAIKGRNQLDSELHKFAGAMLDESIRKEGTDFYDEVARFEELNRVSWGHSAG